LRLKIFKTSVQERQRLIAAAHSELRADRSGPESHQPVSRVSTWRLDPAGNRLPGIEETQGQGLSWNDPQHNASWGEQVRRQLHNPAFNLLATDEQASCASAPVDVWPDNRIALHAGVRYRFDAHGNRIHAQHPGGAQEHYRYNALHQLVEHTRVEPTGEAGLRTTQNTTTHYRYDPFGRRLSKRSTTTSNQGSNQESNQDNASGQTTTRHYGWDGDRLVHIEDDHHIRHTVYEAGSFVPMLQLQRSKGARNIAQLTLGPQAMGMMAPAQQKQMLQALTRALKGFNPHTASGLPAGAQKQMDSAWGAEMNQLVRRGLNTMQQAQAEEEARYPIEVRHIVCDHLGTPLALIDAGGPHQGQITWAARYGAWGDIEAEYNPYQIEQPIRFQGQQFDPETGLHYNRFRYYDPGVGGYISQDPIGLRGGMNKFSYPVNPTGWTDPLGLNTIALGAGGGFAIAGPPGALVGALIGGAILVGGAVWMASSNNAAVPTRTPAEQLSDAHHAAAGNRSDAGYGGNCTPDEHDDLKQKQNKACEKTKGLTCASGQIDYSKADLLQACADARINIARRCFAGGESGHNRQIGQLMRTIGKCLGH
jgi:RHS repeat-associated protein